VLTRVGGLSKETSPLLNCIEFAGETSNILDNKVPATKVLDDIKEKLNRFKVLVFLLNMEKTSKVFVI
jgi:hypothetical protein